MTRTPPQSPLFRRTRVWRHKKRAKALRQGLQVRRAGRRITGGPLRGLRARQISLEGIHPEDAGQTDCDEERAHSRTRSSWSRVHTGSRAGRDSQDMSKRSRVRTSPLVAVRVGSRSRHRRRRGDVDRPFGRPGGADMSPVAARASSDAAAVRRGVWRRGLSSEDTKERR